MTPVAIFLAGLFLAFVITYLLRERNKINPVIKQEVKRSVQDFYIEHVQSYDIDTRWVDVLLDYCEHHNISTAKEMTKIFNCFDKDFEFQFVKDKEIE